MATGGGVGFVGIWAGGTDNQPMVLPFLGLKLSYRLRENHYPYWVSPVVGH